MGIQWKKWLVGWLGPSHRRKLTHWLRWRGRVVRYELGEPVNYMSGLIAVGILASLWVLLAMPESWKP